MKKKNQIVTVYLSPTAMALRSSLKRIKSQGWFSRWVSERLVAEFGVTKKILVNILNEKTKQRNELEKEMEKIAKKIKKLE